MINAVENACQSGFAIHIVAEITPSLFQFSSGGSNSAFCLPDLEILTVLQMPVLEVQVRVDYLQLTPFNFPCGATRHSEQLIQKIRSFLYLGKSKGHCLLGVGMDVVCFVFDDCFNDVSH